MRLERYTHFLSVWCAEGNLQTTKKKTHANTLRNAHTRRHLCISVHLLLKMQSLTHTQPSPQSHSAALPVQWWFSVAVELHTGANPVVLSSILRSRIRLQSSPLLVRFSSCPPFSSVCVSLQSVSLFLSLKHAFFLFWTVLHTWVHSHKSQGERVSARVRENKGN